MSLIDKVLARIESNSKKEFNCIPFSGILGRFSDYLPGIAKPKYYAITAAPGGAKTQFVDFAFVYHPLNFAEEHGINLEIVYFSLELSAEAKILQGISRKLFLDYGWRYSTTMLDSIGNHRISDEHLDKIGRVSDYFKGLEKKITYYDEKLTPSQIFKVQVEKMKENGTYDNFTGVYTPKNPDKYILFIMDHISLIQPESGQTLHQALQEYSSNNIVIRNKFGASIVNVHQQGVDGQVEQFTTKGDNITAKLEPKLAGLGDNRTLARDYDVVLGLFSPKKHDVEFYRGYKTKRFGDKCRWLSIVKNRDGEQDKHLGLYFDGAVGYFEELPKAEEFSILKAGMKADNEQLYDKYAKGLVGVMDTNKQKFFTFN